MYSTLPWMPRMQRIHLILAGIFTIIMALSQYFISYGRPEQLSINVHMDDYGYLPHELKAPAGARVKITLVNKGSETHEMAFLIQGYQAEALFDIGDERNVFWEVELSPGAKQTVTLIAPEDPGTYQMVCGLPGHMEQGMVGILKIY